MKVDLGQLPYKQALEIIEFCFYRNIDRARCLELIKAKTMRPVPDIDWTLEIPEKYLTYFMLKWT